ncbi:MAG: N-acetyltransferase [Chloroflexi bacterium]|nr:N-acetyltransferase [Chloroflexota bacterium]
MLSALVQLGAPQEIDEGVLLGYPTGRDIPDRRLVVGPGARLRAGTVLYEGSVIGADFQTGHNVVVREENRIGDHVSIWSNSVVDYGCVIGHRVKIHTGVYVAQFTVIEDDVFLAPGVIITNDIHPGCPESKRCMKGPTIRRGAQVGGNVTILPYVEIGGFALIGAGSVVTKDIPARSVAYGNPARVVCRIDDLTCETGLTDKPYR